VVLAKARIRLGAVHFVSSRRAARIDPLRALRTE
jgi:hypothetical protein